MSKRLERKRRVREESSSLLTSDGLEAPFPQSPSRPPRGGVYILRGTTHLNYFSFRALYAMHKFVAHPQQPFDWVGDDMIFEDFTLTTRGLGEYTLRQAYDYSPTQKEREWQLPQEYAKHFNPPKINHDIPKQRKTLKDGAARPTGGVSLGDLTQYPSSARQALRKAGFIKPQGGGWCWSPDHPDLIKVKKLLETVTK